MKNYKDIVATLDLGTDKIICIVGSVNDRGYIDIEGVGHQASRGIAKGAIIDVEQTKKSIITAVSVAEKMAGYNVDKIVVSLSNSLVSSNTIRAELNTDGVPIRESDIAKLAKQIRTASKKQGREIIHLIPILYTVDGSVGVKNPINMIGNRFIVDFHLVTAAYSTIKNIENCLKACDLTVAQYVVDSFASSMASEKEHETKDGVIAIDLGGGITSISLTHQDKFVYCGSIPLGGKIITQDIASVLEIDKKTAAKVKVRNANLFFSREEKNKFIDIDINDGNFEAAKTKKGELNMIIKARLDEIMSIIRDNLYKRNIDQTVYKHVVLTGGTSLIPGIAKLFRDYFNVNVRVQSNFEIENDRFQYLNNPIYSTSLGTIKFIEKFCIKSNRSATRILNNKTFMDKIVDWFRV